MKKTSIHLLILSLSINLAGVAQTTAFSEGKLPASSRNLFSTLETRTVPIGSATVHLNNINTKALRDFMKSFLNPVDVKWTIFPDGFRVHFRQDEIQVRLFYDKKGNRAAMLRYYHENKLPFNIRDIVKSKYYDFSIDIITEVSINNKTAYIVRMQDKTYWKSVKVVDGEMEVIEEYLKS